MPEPRINDLDAQNEGIRDGITIPSHLTEALASRGKTCANCPIVFFSANHRKTLLFARLQALGNSSRSSGIHTNERT